MAVPAAFTDLLLTAFLEKKIGSVCRLIMNIIIHCHFLERDSRATVA